MILFFTSAFTLNKAQAPTSSPSLEKHFEDFRVHLQEPGSLREGIRVVVMEIESTSRLMYASLLLVHQSCPTLGNITTAPVSYTTFLLIFLFASCRFSLFMFSRNILNYDTRGQVIAFNMETLLILS